MQSPRPDGNTALRAAVVADLCGDSSLSQRLSGYEERPAQIEMAQHVTEALTGQTHAILEAATGTGKSYAYLIPIVRSGKRAIISTANKALQEQLFYKDIPFVQQHIQHFDAALVKGIGNYVCLDRLEEEKRSLQFEEQDRPFMRLLELTNDQQAPFNGDFELLDFQLTSDIRSRVCGDSDRCAWGKCHYFNQCYIRLMRRKAERAQVIVVNHALLLLNAAAEGAILPAHDLIVLDEAHHLEEEATRAFTATVKASQIYTLLALKTMRAHTPVNLQEDVAKLATLVWQQLEQRMPLQSANRVPLLEPVQDGLHLATLIGDLATALRQQRPPNQSEREAILYDKLISRTKNLAQNLRLVLAVGKPDEYVYYLERVPTLGQRVPPSVEASAAPLTVAAFLKDKLFGKSTIICTSATLATVGSNPARPTETGPNFAYFRRRVGLDPLAFPEVIERMLPLAFDYQSNALLYVPRGIPEPAYGQGLAAQEYTLAIARNMYSLVKASRGRAFLLFSSKRMLDQAYALMAPHLGYPLLRQGEMSRLVLTRRFREEQGAILFGLKSFWEGVDIAGDALSLVVIDKLPFDPPDDPVHEARVAQMKARGENWFGTYVLPQAVLRLKQGVGRLIRTREDRGVMAILDVRLHTKGYGKQVLKALPPAKTTSSIKDVERFFDTPITPNTSDPIDPHILDGTME